MRGSYSLRLAFVSSLLLGALAACSEPPSREEVVAKTTKALTDAVNNYGAALEEFLAHEALKPFLEVLSAQDVVKVEQSASGNTSTPAGTGSAPSDTAGSGGAVVTNDFKASARELADKLAEHLKTKVFTERAVEGSSGSEVTFLLEDRAFCFGSGDAASSATQLPPPPSGAGGSDPLPPGDKSDSPAPNDAPGAADPADVPAAAAASNCSAEIPVEIRIDARLEGEVVSLGIRIDKGGHIGVLRLEPTRISLAVDLAAAKKAYEALVAKSEEKPELVLSEASGRIELALDFPTSGDRRASVSILQAVHVRASADAGADPVSIDLAVAMPLMNARIAGDLVDLTLSPAVASLRLPLAVLYTIQEGKASPEAVLAFDKTSFSIKLGKSEFVRIAANAAKASLSVAGESIVALQSAALSVACDHVEGQDRASCTFDPGVDLSAALAFSRLLTYVTETFNPALDDTYRIILSGAQPAIEFGKAAGDSLLKVLSGTLLLEQKTAAHKVEVVAGECLRKNDQGTTGFDVLIAGQCI